jgi:hypothetical protein
MEHLTATLLRDLGDATTDRFLRLWPAAASPARSPVPSALPVLCWLAPACADGPPMAATVLARLLALAPVLAWRQTYPAHQVPPGFLDRYGWTELIGRNGPVPSAQIAVGFLLLGPGTTYPSHRHAAEEVYLPFGSASWQRGTEPWRDRPAGSPIHHPPWQRHAMRTAGAPLLALYMWCGENLGEAARFD